MLARLGGAIALTMAVMVFSLPLYGMDVYSDSGEPAGVLAHIPGVLRYTSLLVTSVVFILLGLPIFTNSMEQIRQGFITSDLLIILGVVAAIAYSYIATLADSGRVYYETACVILVLVTVGRYLEATGKNKAADSLRRLEALLPDLVDVDRDGETVQIPRSEVRVGDVVIVRAGAQFPVDGLILRGEANIDESIVTGESVAVHKAVGDSIQAGALNLDGLMTVRVSAVGAESTVGRMIAALESARRGKCRFELMADRVVRWFMPTVILLAAGSAFFSFRTEGVEAAIMTGLAVLLISCPCALGIATPMAVWVALDRAAANHVLFRSAAAVEALATVKAMAFDKTGTLTDGEPTVESFEVINPNGLSRDALISASSALASTSLHAVSKGIARFAHDRGIAPVEISNARVVSGLGVTAMVEGREFRLGRPSFVDKAIPARTTEDWNGSLACVGYDGSCAGIYRLKESLRPKAKDALRDLASLNCTALVLTGDHARRAAQVASELEVETRAELTPVDKLREIEAMRERFGPVAMVGDGLNDTPALAAADIGIALGCGADITREAADVCLLGNDLRAVPWALALSRQATKIMRTNLFWAFSYNAVGIPLAMSGRLSPAFAAAAMVISSLLVVGNSLRLRNSAVSSMSR